MIKGSSGSMNEVFSSYHCQTQNSSEKQIRDEKKSTRGFAPLIICGPSGTGKTTLLRRLINDFEDLFSFSISHTTRKPRDGEIDGKDYYFVERESMQSSIDDDEFIESVEFSGNLYGTSKKSVINIQKQGKICILDVDIKGVFSLKQTDLKPKCIFIRPPSLKALEQRLRNRATETEDKIQLRLERALSEIEIGNCKSLWDHQIINDDLDKAYRQLKMFIKQVYTI